MLNYLEERDFDLLGNLDDEESVLEDFYNYSGSTYVCDAISEISDGNVPIYTKEIWENAYDIQEYIEDAIAEGLAPTSGGDVDLTRIMMCGFYQFYSTSLYNNIDNLVYNYIARRIDEHICGLEEEQAEQLDISYLEGRISDDASEIDNNSQYSDIEIIIGQIMEDMKDGLFNQED